MLNRRSLALAAAALLLAGCSAVAAAPQPTPRAPSEPPLPALTPAPDVPGDPEEGRRLFLASGCGGCHTLDGLRGATGVAGPNLTNVALRPTLAGERLPNTPENLARWIRDPPALKPDTPMPKLGLTDAQARDLAAFLESQPYNP